MAMLNYRNTPLDCGKSPAQLLMNRELKTRLPQAFLESQAQDSKTLEKIRKIKSNQKRNYDKRTKKLKPILEGQTVRLYDSRQKGYPEKGVVSSKHSHQSYNVLTEQGHTLRRNREHLRTTLETFQPNMDYEDLETTGKEASQKQLNETQ